jgi:putative RNA 2'-phosphotransferase
MNSKTLEKISRVLSLVLRHEPAKVGVNLDEAGWADVRELITCLNRHGYNVDRGKLEIVVETNSKKRFAFNADKSRIRANQGHSIPVDLQLEAVKPPEFLWHGTVGKFISSIRTSGLQKQQRLHVHLSADTETAAIVGNRRGSALLLKIHAARMHADGQVFYRSANGVWLTDHVPPVYIDFPEGVDQL